MRETSKKVYLNKRLKRCLWVLGSSYLGLIILLILLDFLQQPLYLWGSLGLLLLLILSFILGRLVYLPYREQKRILALFNSGYTFQDLFLQKVHINSDYEEMLKKLQLLLDQKSLLEASERQAQYLALQNQINPHFLYNTLEGIRGETLNAGLDNVSKMTEALATFFRYNISRVEYLVTLEDELSNIKNYFIIQQYRFGDRLKLTVEWDQDEEEKVLKYRLPKLTLQPIVENAICHGLEEKVEKGTVNIKIETTPERLIIRVSDDGVGIAVDTLRSISQKLNQVFSGAMNETESDKGGIALKNVNRRIKLLFGEAFGLSLYSTVNLGTDVVITLPRITELMRDL